MRLVLDVNILVRANDRAAGLARELLRELLRQGWTILLSGEMLVELARVLRYPHLQARYNLAETDIYDYIQFLRQATERVVPDMALAVPIRDVADTAVVQTAIAGEADLICTLDTDFCDVAMTRFLSQAGIQVLDDVALMQMLRASARRKNS
ncbi:MAG TPA: putative toxin-antitoxin system toxin component, PIN family [Dongiaceae bacterium]|nr:putative toxin-antitoxin system toxin component, PIN family [Dongiaceae bacterium]